MKRWTTWATVWVLVSCVTPVFSQWLPGQGPQKSAPAAKADANKTNFLEKFFISPATEKEFAQAVRKGDVATVKRLVEKHPWKPFLHNKIVDSKKLFEYPVCIAAAKGHNDLLKYMHTKDAKSVSLECKDGNAFDAAIANKKADTAILLMNFKVPTSTMHDNSKPPLVKVAQSIKDTASLKKLISALLNSKANPNEVWYAYGGGPDGDSLYHAAASNNINFITILRDEMKKRGQVLDYAIAITYSCDYYPEGVRREEEGPKGSLLQKYGIELIAHNELTTYGCD